MVWLHRAIVLSLMLCQSAIQVTGGGGKFFRTAEAINLDENLPKQNFLFTLQDSV
jgi:hypothetical protein